LIRGHGRLGDVRLRLCAAGAIAEPEFNVLAELLQLRLELTLCVLQLLDSAVGLAKFFLKPVDTNDEARGVVWIALRTIGNVSGRRGLAVKDVELRLRRRCKRDAGDEHTDEASAK
jgi:hypothetical protein